MFPPPDNPADAAVFPGETAVFQVQAINPYTMDSTNLTYAWRKVGEPTVLSTTDTLQILNAQISNEGEYYCTVTVTSTTYSADSPAATLVVKRLISHWPFEGDLNDAIDTNHGEMIGDNPEFGSGIIGSLAIEFEGTNKEYAIVPSNAHEPYSSWTLSWWENSDPDTSPSNYESMLSCGIEPDGWDIFDFARYRVYRYAFGLNVPSEQKSISGRYQYTENDPSLYPRGQWFFHTISYDDATGIAKWFINGEQVGTFGEDLPISFDGFQGQSLYVGNCKSATSPQPYAGLIDDLRLYNYPQEPVEVAVEYTNVIGGEICVELPAGDFTGDCYVNINDLVDFVESWLDCNKWPVETCQ